MSRVRRVLITVLCVLVGIVVIAAVALRLVLTRDRLVSLVVPRIERVVDAKIGIGDIGIRFPFGFGVDIKDLTFDKDMPDKKKLSFASERVVVKASLLSLIRKRPEIKKVEVKGGVVKLFGAPGAMSVTADELGLSLSVKPEEYGYLIDCGVEAGSVSVTWDEKGMTVTLEDLGFTGRMESDRTFDNLKISESELRWGNMMSVRLSGKISELKTERLISIEMESENNPLPPVMDWLVSSRMDAVAPALGQAAGYEIKKGTYGFEARLEGKGGTPSGLGVSGKFGLEDVRIDHKALDKEIGIGGEVKFSNAGMQAEVIKVTLGRSRADVGFTVTSGANRKVEDVRFSAAAEIDLSDAVPSTSAKGIRAGGRLTVSLRGGGSPGVLTRLVPSKEKGVSPEETARSWKQLKLEGEVRGSGISFSSGDNPFDITSLNTRADVSGADIDAVTAEFDLSGRPFRCEASFKGILPAMAELAYRLEEAGKEGQVPDLGKVLDGAVSAPAVRLKLVGRALDLVPLQKSLSGKGEREPGRERGGAGGSDKGAQEAVTPASVILLKNTAFTAAFDTVITEKAVFTAVDARGTVLNGRLEANRVNLEYAGGKGRAALNADLRDPLKVRTKVNVSFEGIEAGRALGMLHSMGGLVEGRFSFKSNANFETGAGINPLMTMNAEGSTFSSRGRVNFSRYIAPLNESGLIDLSVLEKFDFREWSGNFMVKGGRLMTDDWMVTSEKGDWFIKGSFGFDGTLDYAIKLVIPPETQRGMKDLKKYGDLVNLLKDQKGNLILDLDLGGTVKSPKLSLDMSGAKKKAGEELMENIKKKAKDLLKK